MGGGASLNGGGGPGAFAPAVPTLNPAMTMTKILLFSQLSEAWAKTCNIPW